jgi:hypothetical protein
MIDMFERPRTTVMKEAGHGIGNHWGLENNMSHQREKRDNGDMGNELR